MVQQNPGLDATFAALADPTRRAILTHLRDVPAPAGALAAQFPMSLTGLMKHLQVLEAAGLVRTEKVGRVRWCHLGPQRLEDATAWIAQHREHLIGRLDRLEAFLAENPEDE
jgi:DNA-binding transcriptional ArsR family regulator